MITTLSVHNIKSIEVLPIKHNTLSTGKPYCVTTIVIRTNNDGGGTVDKIEFDLFADDAEAFARLFPVTEAA